MPTKRILLVLILASAWAPVFAERNISAQLEDGWIIASQGSDESAQTIRVKVWGSTRVEAAFHQLDDDAEEEFVVTSRSTGSGPYYKIQIIDFLSDGILAWSYDSAGVPKIQNKVVLLGKLSKGYQGAATKPKYESFRLTTSGLSKSEAE